VNRPQRLNTRADLFGICRSTLWNAIRDVLPVLEDRRIAVTPQNSVVGMADAR
jgi:hypothetical protein